jgi:hypothetical protein
VVFDRPTPGAGNAEGLDEGVTIIGVVMEAGQLTLSWVSEPGVLYQVEYKNDLNDDSWQNLGDPIPAVAATTQFTDAEIGGLKGRLYRITRQN